MKPNTILRGNAPSILPSISALVDADVDGSGYGSSFDSLEGDPESYGSSSLFTIYGDGSGPLLSGDLIL